MAILFEASLKKLKKEIDQLKVVAAQKKVEKVAVPSKSGNKVASSRQNSQAVAR